MEDEEAQRVQKILHLSETERHLKPLRHANEKWMGQDSNLRCFLVTDLQSAAFATRLPILRCDQGESVYIPFRPAQVHNLLDYGYPMTTVIPMGLEPNISGLKGRCPDLLD